MEATAGDIVPYSSIVHRPPFSIEKAQGSDFSLHNSQITATFAGNTGLLKSVTTKQDGVQHRTNLEFVQYGTVAGHEKSGAYLFLPDGKAKHSNESSTSEGEEGEVSEDDGRGTRSRQSYCSTLSSEGPLSEEENTSERSAREMGDDCLMSTNSSENLQLQLHRCMVNDGLSSDGELKFRRLQQRASPQRSLEMSHCSTSDSDDCSDATVYTVHRKRSVETRDW